MPEISSLAGAPVAMAVLVAVIKTLSASRLEARILKHVAILERLPTEREAPTELENLVRDEVAEMVKRDRVVLARKPNWSTIAACVLCAVVFGGVGGSLAAQPHLWMQIFGWVVLAFGVIFVVVGIGTSLWKETEDASATPDKERDAASVGQGAG